MNLKNCVIIVNLWLLGAAQLSAKELMFGNPFADMPDFYQESPFSNEQDFYQESPFNENNFFQYTTFEEEPPQLRAFATEDDTAEGINLTDPNNSVQKLLPVGDSFPLWLFAGIFSVQRYYFRKKEFRKL